MRRMAKKNEAGLTVCGYDQARFISKLAEFRTWKARAAAKGEARVLVFSKVNNRTSRTTLSRLSHDAPDNYVPQTVLPLLTLVLIFIAQSPYLDLPGV